MHNYIFIIVISILLSSCSNSLKNTIGLSTPGPDEYSVRVNKSLEIPPHFDLNDIEKERKPDCHSEDSTSLNKGQKSLLNKLKN